MTVTPSLFAGVILAGSFLSAAQAGEVHAIIDDIRSARGHVLCSLFQSADGFPREPQRALKRTSVTANAGAVCTFSDLPAGTYAIAVFHDENDNGVLDTNFAGMPREGYGFSNNHRYTLHPASFEESRFELVGRAAVELHIGLKY
jgi:uncharacterized protein (DUF2141 family)